MSTEAQVPVLTPVPVREEGPAGAVVTRRRGGTHPNALGIGRANHYDMTLARRSDMPARDPFPWFRLWHRLLNEHKVQSLPDRLFKHWINILCLASQQKARGVLPAVAEIAFHLRVTQCDAEAVTEELISRRLLDRDGDKIVVHDWDDFQPVPTTSAERTRRYRKRLKQKACDVTRDVTVTPPSGASHPVTVTPPDTDTDTDSDSENTSLLPPPTDAGAGAAAGGGGDGSGRGSLERWARAALGDRYDLEHLGPNLTAWSLAYPADWVRLAVEAAAVAARPGGLVAYAHKLLARSHAAGRCVVADTLAPPPPAGTNGHAGAGVDPLSPAQRRQRELVAGFRRRADDARRAAGASESEATDGEG